jgi:hypothetical protein
VNWEGNSVFVPKLMGRLHQSLPIGSVEGTRQVPNASKAVIHKRQSSIAPEYALDVRGVVESMPRKTRELNKLRPNGNGAYRLHIPY